MLYLNSKNFFYSVSALALLCFSASSDIWALTVDEEGKRPLSGPPQPQTGEMGDVKGMRVPSVAGGRVVAKPDANAHLAPTAGAGAGAPSRMISQTTASPDLYERGKALFTKGNFQEAAQLFVHLSQKDDFRGTFYLRYIRREHAGVLDAIQEKELARAEAFLAPKKPTQDPKIEEKRKYAQKGFDDYLKELKERNAAKAQFAEAKSPEKVLKLLELSEKGQLTRDQAGNLITEASHRDQVAGHLYGMIMKISNIDRKFKSIGAQMTYNMGVLIAEGRIHKDENGLDIEEGQRNEVAACLYRRAIKGGDLQAATNLAVLIYKGKVHKNEKGEDVTENRYQEIGRLHGMAIKGGFLSAANRLALLIHEGQVHKNEKGDDITENCHQEAGRLFSMAINAGLQEAATNLGFLIHMEQVHKNEKGEDITAANRHQETSRLFSMAANAGSLVATYNLGVMYILNPQTHPQAFKYLTRALEGGCLAAKPALDFLKKMRLNHSQSTPVAATEPAKGVSAAAGAGAALLKTEAAGTAISAVDVKDDTVSKDVHLTDSAPAAGAGADAKPVKKSSDDISSEEDDDDDDVKAQPNPEDNKKEERRHKERRKAHEKKLKEQEEVFKKLLARAELTAAEREKLFMPSDPSSQVKIKWEGSSLKEFRALPPHQTRKVQLLVDAIKEGDSRYGAPECLKGDLKDWMSRRIDKENRLVYQYDQTQNVVVIRACRGHY